MSTQKPIFYSALILTGVNLLLRFVSTSFQVYLSASIGAEGIGLLQLVMSTGSLALVAGIGGIRTATMYLTAEEIGRNRSGNVRWILSACLLYSILISGSVACLLHLFAPWIAQNWIGNPETVPSLRLIASFLPVVCLTGVMTGYFTAVNRIGTLATVEVGEQLCTMGLTITLLKLWAGSDSLRACLSVILGSSFGSVFTLVCLILLRIRERHSVTERIPVANRLLQTAVPLALADDLKSGITTAESLMVPKRLSLNPQVTNSLAAFGLVSGMVFPVVMFPAAILFGLTELLIPELARCAAGGHDRRIRYLLRRSLRITLVYSLLFSGLIYLLSDWLCLRLYANTEAAVSMRLYALLIPILYCDCITDAMIKGLGQQKICVRYNILTSFLDIVFLYFLLPRYGMEGYYASFLLTHLLNFGLSFRRLLKITKKQIHFRSSIYAVLCAMFGIQCCNLVSQPQFRGICYPLILSTTLCLLNVVTKEDWRWMISLIRKKDLTNR